MLLLPRLASSARRRFAVPVARALSAAAPVSIGEYEHVIAEVRGKSGLITMNRPPVNAMSDAHLQDIVAACKAFDADDRVGAVVITGNHKFFCGGADIKEMSGVTYGDAIARNMFVDWDFVSNLNKPVIAAVNGYALGGGCELAMMCDIMVCGEATETTKGAQFGQPEITLGVIPGCGGTQRLTKAVGKALAMDLILTGRFMGSEEALRSGLVARTFPAGDGVVEGALAMADKISSFSKPVTASKLFVVVLAPLSLPFFE